MMIIIMAMMKQSMKMLSSDYLQYLEMSRTLIFVAPDLCYQRFLDEVGSGCVNGQNNCIVADYPLWSSWALLLASFLTKGVGKG